MNLNFYLKTFMGVYNIEYKKLGEIATVLNGARLERFNKENVENQDVLKINSNGEMEIVNESISRDLNNKFYTKKGDIILQTMVPNNLLKIEQDNVIVSMNYVIIRPHEEYYSNYICYLLKYHILNKEIAKLREGSTLKTIRVNYLKDIKIPIVEYEKQEKIGNLLNALEKRKKLYNQLIESTENLEKSILNELME